MDYTVIRSHRRTMALEVCRDGSVVVRVPQFVSRDAIERFVAAHAEWLRRAQEKMTLRAESRPEPAPEEAEKYRRMAKDILPQRVAFWSAIIGVQPTALHITSARTRFGSCSAKNSISFSWRLMQYSPAAIDYVVVHELCHTRYHDHSAAFWREVAKYMPDYRERKKELKA